MSLPQVLLWMELRKRPGGYKFRKEFPMRPYTIDFVCLSARLAVEVDGVSHDMGDNPQQDLLRDRFLMQRGFQSCASRRVTFLATWKAA
jgi:very-short-patch-repair endonuclease